MISLEAVCRTYPGSERAAVSDVSLEVPAGEVCVLVGPSGCGKSTTLRMVNRLVEPDAGRVRLDGRDVRDIPPDSLRRGIGYAIQGVGLFPHWTVRENVGCVPGLLGWERGRVAGRVTELLELVGLDPERHASAYPSELSGGEAQRVGVARALAADPPVLLMDEPFGAVDPLTRERLQSEFAAIQRRLRKTVVFVTHDIDEAIRLGDSIAVMRDGRLVQHDRPERVLAYPADRFVLEFVGGERALRRLGLASVSEALGPVLEGWAPGASVSAGATMRDALTRILETGEPAVGVVDSDGRPIGSVSVEAIVERFGKPLS